MTQPSQTACAARTQQRCQWNVGRVMGGSSSINYMVYLRGNPLDYDEWELLGNPGWNWKNVYPYFLKSEDNRNTDNPNIADPNAHATGGYQPVSIHAYQDQNIMNIINAFQELGLPMLDQAAGPQQIGVSINQATVANGQRVSTNDAFIMPIRNKRSNLNIMTNANVMRVLIDPGTKKAYGVEYMKDKMMYRALAKNEVIVSAGAIYGPKLLMLSGIGPKEHLSSLGIEVLQDLPVGYNLHDHTTFDGIVVSVNKTSTMVDDMIRNMDLQHYIKSNSGPLSGNALLQLGVLILTKYATDGRPEIQYSFDSTNIQNFYTDPILTFETNTNAHAYYDGITVRPILLNPQSRGIVMLNNSDPVFGDLIIQANTFTEQIDILRMVDGAQQSLKMLMTETMRKIDARLVDTPLPACADRQFASDEYWACIMQSYTNTIHHPVGTCKMGPNNDKTAVVDARLKVHGIKNLRVIDGSIIPIIPRGNTNGPIIMIGEIGSDFIKEEWMNKQNDARNNYYEVQEIIEEKI